MSKNSVPHSPPPMNDTSQSAPKSPHSMSHGGQSMPHGPQPMPHGPPSMSHGPQSMHDAYSMPYGGYGGYSLPPHGAYQMGYGSPPAMSHGGYAMSQEPQSLPRGMYTQYSGQAENKNRMKTFSKTQRETLSREGAKTGTSHQRGAVPETMNRMTMDYQGRFIDSRGRVVDYSHKMDPSDGSQDGRYIFGREMPRERQIMYDYGMPSYMYGNMMDNPDLVMDMEMQGRYPPFFDQYGDDDYSDGFLGNYMDDTGSYNTDFPAMHFPENRTMDSAGRYGDVFER